MEELTNQKHGTVTFGMWLSVQMKHNNLKASDIARATQSHHNVVRSWMRDKNIPSALKLALLFDKFSSKNINADMVQECFTILIKDNEKTTNSHIENI